VIFAREVTDKLTSLVKKIDAATVKNSGKDMCSFVVVLSDEEGMAKKLAQLAKKEKLKETVLTLIEKKDGPPGYKIAKDADVTILLYKDKTVKANYAFKKGKLTDKDITKVIADLKLILKGD
jgi:hypothetical protein